MQDTFSSSGQPRSFRAVLHPHRSLGPRGFLLLMVVFGGVSFVTGMAFLLMGAWPVLGFFGLDVLLLYVAFRLSYRSGRAYELVEVTRDCLFVTRVEPTGLRQSFSFNPYWARVRLSERTDGRTNLAIASHGRELEFGRFLNDEERRDFAKALEGALAVARAGGG